MYDPYIWWFLDIINSTYLSKKNINSIYSCYSLYACLCAYIHLYIYIQRYIHTDAQTHTHEYMFITNGDYFYIQINIKCKFDWVIDVFIICNLTI